MLLSGRGSNFEALAASATAGRMADAEIAVVISNHEGAPGIDRARERKIPALVIPSRGLEREEYDRLVVPRLRSAGSSWYAWRDSCGCSRPISSNRFPAAY